MRGKQNTILIVDDDADSLDILCEYFQGVGFRALVANNAQAALESISHVLPDIILLDVKMPGMDGFEMAARLKAGEDTQDIPIIFVTALSDVNDRVRGLELGAVDYIGKPIHLPEVTARINTHLTIRNLQKRLEAQNAQLEREMARRAQSEAQRDATLEALLESEEKYRVLVENSPDGIFISNDRRFIYANRRLEEIAGFSQDELLSMSDPLGVLLAPDDQERLRDYAKSLLQGGSTPGSYELRGIRKNGEVVWLKLNASSFVLSGQRVLQGTVQDISARVQAEREILQLSQFRESIIDNANVWLNVLDEKARVMLWNKAAEEISGYSRQEVFGRSEIWEWFYPDEAYRAEMLTKATAIIERNKVLDGFETTIRCKNGQERIISWNSRNLLGEQGQSIGSIALGRDVTQQAQAEAQRDATLQELAKTNQLLETIFDYTPLLIANLDPQFNFIRVNRAYAQADEREPDFFPGKNHFDLYPNAENEEIFGRVLATGEPHFEYVKPFEYAEHPERGVSYWDWRLAPTRDADGAVMGLVLTLAEVTERVQAEKKLRESEARLALAIEATEAVLFERSLDLPGLYLSPRWTDILGHSLEELPPDDKAWEWMLGLIHPDDIAGVKYGLGNFVQRGAERYRKEFRMRHKSGHWVWIQVNGQAIERDEQGRPTKITGLLFDITERKQAEQERQDLINKLEAQNAELERFAYTISHDLKSPLITIQGFLGFLLEDVAAGNMEQMQADAARISNAATKMGQLLEDLLELSRIGRLVNSPERALLGELAHEVLDLLAGQLQERGVQVEIAPDLLEPDGPLVYGDRARLLEVLQNLVDNAIKYMGAQPHPRVEIGARRDADEQVFYVRDNGLGIEPYYQDRVFELFEKLDPGSEGSGVGLAIVQRIVEVHGGRVWVESAGLGQGSTFCFTLADR